MEFLPNEIKWHICHFVKADPLGTLADLNLTSRSWHDATAPILYETLRIRFRDSASLQQVALELKEGGRGRLFLRHARRLDIVCFWDYTDKPWLVPNSKYQSMEPVHYGPPASGNTFLEYRLKECLDPRLWSRFPGPSYYVEEEWQPLVSLIAHLERLSELNYVVKNMLKPGFVYSTTNTMPLRFKNLDDLRSSGLHTVAVDYFMDEKGSSWVHSDTILLILCMVRTLKHLHIRGRGFSSVALLRLAGKYNTTAVKPIPVACLDSLSFTSPARYGAWEKTLLKLASAVDLSRLRSLDIAVHSDSTLLRQAASILTGLERLFLTMDLWNVRAVILSTDDQDMIAAVQAFNPLKYLWLRGLRRRESLHRILMQHGRSLKGLTIEPWDMNHKDSRLYTRYLYPLFYRQDVTELSRSCPNLQELRLPIKRNGGRPPECDIYKAMGQFPQLHTLVINLGCYHWSDSFSSGNGWTALLRETLINAATDENLARGIWDLIISKQSTQRLRRLCIVPFGAGVYEEAERDAIWEVSRSFLVTPNGCTGEPPDVREIETESRDLLELLRRYEKRLRGITGLAA